MNRRVFVGVVLGCIAALGACSEDTQYQSVALDCGEGQALTFEAQTYCVYDNEIIEEGFRCPEAVPYDFEFEGFLACGEDEALPEGFEDGVRERGLFEPEPDPNPGQDPDPNPGQDPDPNPDPGPTMEPDAPPVMTGECPNSDELESPTEADEQATLFAGPMFLPVGRWDSTEVISNGDNWQELLGELQIYGSTTQQDIDALAGAEIDFDAEWIVVASHTVGSTCFDIQVNAATQLINGFEHVQANFLVQDGSCGIVCDAEGYALVIIRVARSEQNQEPTICHSVRSVCNNP